MAEKEVRLVDAFRLEEKLDAMYHESGSASWHCAIYDVENFLDMLPTIDPESLRPHGKWIICSDGYYPYCSECKEEPKGGNMTKFCPNCGAKMDKED